MMAPQSPSLRRAGSALVTGVLLASYLLVVLPGPAAATHDPPLVRCAAGVQSFGWNERTCTKGGELRAAYVFMVAREPDPSGFANYMSQPYSDYDDVRVGLYYVAVSQEAWNTWQGNTGNLLIMLYWSALNRAPDSGGYSFWVDLASRNPWPTIVAWFTESVEYQNRLNDLLRNSLPVSPQETYHEADYYVAGRRAGRHIISYSYFAAIRSFRAAADPWDPLDWHLSPDNDTGCSGPIIYPSKLPCQRHDFGWNNFGRGPQLERTSARKSEIDDQLYQDLVLSCNYLYWNYDPRFALCIANADGAWLAVRNADW